MRLEFDPLASKEFEDAYEYHEAQEAGLGEKLRLAMWAGIGVLEQFPELGEEVRPGIRKLLLRRFPYGLIYSVATDSLYIVAVAHSHRDPDYWIDRVRQ